MTDIALRPFTIDDLDAAVVLSEAERWPHRREDWAMLAGLSQGVVAVEGARVVGTAFLTPYGPDDGTVDMIIVDKALRGRGLGRRLVETVMSSVEGRRLRLVATADGLPLYRKLGFVDTGAISQHQGLAAATDAPEDVETSAPADRDAILALDHAAYGADRGDLLRHLLADGEALVLRDHDGVSGFAIARRFGRGVVVGPIVAPNVEAAQRLLAAHFATRTGAFLRVDTPTKTGLGPWLAERGLAQTGDGVAMLRGQTPERAASGPRTFALASQAFG